MPEQGYYGTETNPLSDLYSERKVITPQTSGGSLEEGEYRLRTDLNSGDRIATYQINVGNGVEEAPVFPVSMSADSQIQKVRQVYVPGEGWGFVPVLENDAAYPQIQLYHSNDDVWYKWHDSQYAIPPDSGVSRWELEQEDSDSWGDNGLTDNTSAGYSTDAAVGSYAKAFDGTDDLMTTGVEIIGAQNQSWTITGWVNLNATGGYHFGEWDSDAVNDSVRIDTSSGDFRVIVRESSLIEQVSGVSPSTGQWYFIAGVMDASAGEIELYVDSASQGTASWDGTFGGGGEYAIGAAYNGDAYTDGLIDDPRIYSKALTASEVSNLESTGSI